MFGFGKSKRPSKRSSKDMRYVSLTQWQDIVYGGGYHSLANNPDVRIAVDTIAELVSNMSIHLLENTDTGDKRVNNQLQHLIDVEPAKGMTRKAWITKIVRDLYLYGDGNSICRIIVQPGSEYLDELRPIDMDYVSYQYDGQKNDMVIMYRGTELSENQLVHFMINPDSRYPKIGTGFREPLADILENLVQANRTKATFMKGKYMPNVVIKVDSDSEELASQEGREEVKRKYLESDGAMEPWIVPAELLEVQQVKPLTLKDIAINESVEIDKKTVAGMFGIPPFLLGVGTFNKDEFNNFVNTRIAGLGQVIAQTLTRDVLFKTEWYFKFNPRSLYQYNISDLVSAGKEMVDRTAMSRNEWRDWIGLEPREDMEELITLENYIPTSKLGDQGKLKGGDNGEGE